MHTSVNLGLSAKAHLRAFLVGLFVLVGALSSILGLTFIFGWLTHNMSLVQGFLRSTPMHSCTALCFLLCGIALISLVLKREKLAFYVASAIGVIGLASLFVHLLGLNREYGQLILQDFSFTDILNPSFMPASSALCFVFVALFVMSKCLSECSPKVKFFSGVLAALILAVGSVALFGYLSEVHSSIGLGRLTNMALYDSLVFFVIGLAMLLYSWVFDFNGFFPSWLPVVVAVLFMAISTCIWQSQIVREHEQIHRLVQTKLETSASEIEDSIANIVNALERSANRWSIRGGTPKDEWHANAAILQRQITGIMAIEWVDPTFHVRWIEPLEGNESRIDMDMAEDESLRVAIEAAKLKRTATVTRTIAMAQDGWSFLVLMPIYRDESFLGFVLAVMSVSDFSRSILEHVEGDFAVKIYDGDNQISTLGDWTEIRQEVIEGSEVLLPGGVRWHVSVAPTLAFVNRNITSLSVTLAVGLLLSLLVALAIHFARKSWQNTEEIQQHKLHLEEVVGRRTRDLKERMKELNCLHAARVIMSDTEKPVSFVLQQIVELLPPSWQFPEVTCASIVFEGQTYTTKSYEERGSLISALIASKGVEAGRIEVRYLEERPQSHEGPFMLEERQLLDTLASRISEYVESQRANAAFMESENKFRCFFQQSVIGMAITSPKRDWIIVNDALCEMLGYTEQQLCSTTWSEITHPEDRAADEDQFDLMASGEIDDYRIEKRLIRSDGTPVATILSVACERNASGEMKYVFAQILDISAFVEAKRRLGESEHLYRTLLNSLPQKIFQKSRDYKWVTINESLAKDLNIAPEEVFGKSDGDLFPPELADKYHADDVALFESGETCEFEERYVVGGVQRWINTVKAPLRDKQGVITGLLGIFWDITDKKNADLELHKAYLRLTSILDSVDALIYVADFDTYELLFLNKFGRDVFGEYEGKKCWEVLQLGQVGPCAFCTNDKLLNADGLPAGIYRWEVQNSKTSKWFDCRDQAILWSDGRFVRMEIAADITIRKVSELKLQEALVDLERSNKDLEQFAYVASHDLQEPLRMVSSYTQLLSERYKEQLDERAAKYINYAVDGAVRMQGLINDLLAFSRVGSRGKAMEIVSSQKIVADVLFSLKILIEKKNARLVVGKLPDVRADSSQLSQLFQNLVENAIKFGPETGCTVEISASSNGNEWVFTVSDNGIGIDPKYHDRIFTIFQRLHSREKYAGSGIGLAIARKIVERHGGKIWVESEDGKGSKFHFSIKGRALR